MLFASMFRRLMVLTSSGIVLANVSGMAFAQRGFGPPRGGPEGGGALIELRSEDVRREIGITEEQLNRLDELVEQSRSEFNVRDYLDRLRSADGDERDAIRAEMREAFEKQRQLTDQHLQEVLTPQQFTRLNQLRLQRQGLRALTTDPVAQSLQLSEDQRHRLDVVLQEFEEARRSLGFSATEQEREQFRASWSEKALAILTAEQQENWKGQLGDPPAQSTADAPEATVPNPVDTPSATAQADERADEAGDGAVVASFGASPGSASSPVQSGDQRISFNFRYAPWETVLKLFADAANLTLDLNDIPSGTFNHYDSKSYTISEALDVINGYLLPRGYVLVHRDNFLVCVNIDNGVPPNLVPTVTVEELPNRGRNELMTVVFPLEGVEDVASLATEVEKLKGPQGTVAGITPARTLVVTDIGANLIRINHILRNFTTGPQDKVFKNYQLEHIFVDDAEYLVRSLLGLDTGTAAATAASATSQQQQQQDRFARFRGGGDPRQQDPRFARAPVGTNTRTSSSTAHITSDPRTNRLLVSATLAEHKIIEEALKTVDVSDQSPLASDRPYGAQGDKQVAVIPLAVMDPSSATATLQAMFLKDGDQAPTIYPDLTGRQLMVRGTETQLYQIRQLLTDLGEDGTGSRGLRNRGPVRTYNTSGRDPQEVLDILQRMWGARNGSGSLRIVDPSDRGRSSGLDLRNEPPPQRPQRPAEESDDPGAINLQWPDVPHRDAPQGEVQVRPGQRQSLVFVNLQAEEAPQSTPAPSGGDSARQRPYAPPVGANAEPEVAPSTGSAPSAGSDRPVTINVIGGELVISGDEAKLDELEAMLDTVMQAVPARTKWSIFPLKSADAMEAAAMLEQLFPDSSVAQPSTATSGSFFGGLTSGMRSFGSSVASMTGLDSLGEGPQTLRIIPDLRLNALFVTGPSYRVDEVEEMLTVLDATGLTESLRDRQPQMIPVLYANVDEVYEIVKSVYEPELEPPQRSNDRSNPFAAMMGGGGDRGSRGNNGGNQQMAATPLVTLGVDRTTSHLIVSADDGTFQEIKALVESVDNAAREARRSVKVVGLQNTNASMIEGSLNSLMPKVTVSTSGSRTSSSSGSSGSSGPSRSSGSSSDAEAMQRRMDYFRAMQGGGGPPGGGFSRGGGGSPFGGGGSPFGGGGFNRSGGNRGGGSDRGGR